MFKASTLITALALLASVIAVPSDGFEKRDGSYGGSTGGDVCPSGQIALEKTFYFFGKEITYCECGSLKKKRDNLEARTYTSSTPCSGCGTNSIPICSNGQCSCKCADGYTLQNKICVKKETPKEYCEKTGGTWNSSKQKCVCKSPYCDDDKGGCNLPPSPKARKAKKDQILLADAAFCPDNEVACAVGSGYECLDTTQSLESCGGCIGNGGINCLDIFGSENVACISSKCIVLSCAAGLKLVEGECVLA